LNNTGCDQKVSVHLTITVQSSGARRIFDHPVLLAWQYITPSYKMFYRLMIA